MILNCFDCRIFILIVSFIFHLNSAPLHEAAKKGDIKEITRLVKTGVDINSPLNLSWGHASPLELAIKNKKLEAAQLLIALGADVNGACRVQKVYGNVVLQNKTQKQYYSQYGPLRLAVEQGYFELVKLLLDKGAHVDGEASQIRVNYSSPRKQPTPLCLAVQAGNLEIVDLLISRKADINMRDTRSKTALDSAIESGKSEKIVLLLLNSGAKISSQRNNWLHAAAASGHLLLVDLLIKKGFSIDRSDTQRYNGQGNTPLYKAAEHGKAQVVKFLLSKGASVEGIPSKATPGYHRGNKSTPLHAAAAGGHLEVVKLLVAHKAKMNAVNKSGHTQIKLAFMGNKPKVVSFLLQNGCSIPSIRHVPNMSALSYAAQQGQLRMVKLLLEHGALVDDENITNFLRTKSNFVKYRSPNYPRKKSPIYFAVQQGHAEIVQLLIDHGAQITILNCFPMAATRSAQQKKADKVIENRKDDIKKLFHTIRNGEVATALALLIQKKNLDILDSMQTPLHAAMNANQPGIAIFLMKQDAWLGDGHSSHRYHTQFVSYNSQIDLSIQNLFVWATTKGHLEIVQFTLDKALKVISHVSPLDKEVGLSLAVQGDHPKVVELLLKHGVKITKEIAWAPELLYSQAMGSGRVVRKQLTESQSYDSLLHWAADKGHLNVAKEFLNRYKNINVDTPPNFPDKDTKQWGPQDGRDYRYKNSSDYRKKMETPLHIAARKGHLELVKFLIVRKADVNRKADVSIKVNYERSKSITSLHLAAAHGKIGVVGFLIEKGAHTEALDGQSYTPLHYATEHGHFETVQKLVEEFADPKALNQDKYSMLHIALAHQHPKIAHYFIEKNIHLHKKNKRGNTPLHIAIQKGYLDVVKALVAKKVDLNVLDSEQQTALHIALNQKHSQLAQYLIDQNVKLNLVSDLKQTPLHLAIQSGQKDIAMQLIEKVRNLNLTNKIYQTPLHLAIQFGHKDIAKLLIQKGVNLDIKNNGNQTPLHIAINKGYTDISTLCIKSGADLFIKDAENNRSLDLARKKQNQTLITLIMATMKNPIVKKKAVGKLPKKRVASSKGSSRSNAFIDAVKANNTKKVAQMIAQGAHVNITTKTLLTPLHFAAKSGNLAIAQLLVDNGAKIDAISSKKTFRCTPVHNAVWNGNAKIVEYLLSKGADCAIKNRFGTPLENAIKKKHSKIIALLKKHLNQTGKQPVATMSLKPSFLIDHISIAMQEKLGSGGFGNVYKALWRKQAVAVKQLHAQQMTDETKEVFQNESKIWSDLRHPNIVQLFGICMPPAPYSMVMPYYPQGSLRKLLKRQTLTWDVRRQLAKDITSGLIYLHSKNILHRDLKSSNILISKQEGRLRALLTDFGLSTVKRETTTSSLISAMQVAGTLLWMAPELLRGKSCTKKSDIYGLGMVLLELATQKLPYADAHHAIIPQLIKEGELPEIPEETPPYFAQLIKLCCAQSSKMRLRGDNVLDWLDQKNVPKLSLHTGTMPSAQLIKTGSPDSLVEEPSTAVLIQSMKKRRKPPSRARMCKHHNMIVEAINLLDKAYPENLAVNDAEALAYRNETLFQLNIFKTISQFSATHMQELEEIKQELKDVLDE